MKRTRRAPSDTEKVIGYRGTSPTGSLRNVNAPRAQGSVYELIDMGEVEEPKFRLGQKVKFGRRGPRTVENIRLTTAGWEYYVSLIAPPHGSLGNTYAEWRREKGLVTVATS